MNDRGVFAVSRGLFDHPFFAPEPFTEREAWTWLLGTAAWRPTRSRVGRKLFSLTRGQLVLTERFLAEKWKWTKSRVHRYLIRLKIESMIETQVDHDATRITICNYDKWQFDRTAAEPQTEPQSESQANHSRTITRTKEEELIKEKMQPSAAPTVDADYFRRGREVLGNDPGIGGLLKNLLKAKGGNHALARAAIETASTKDKPREYIGGVLRGAQQQQDSFLDQQAGIL